MAVPTTTKTCPLYLPACTQMAVWDIPDVDNRIFPNTTNDCFIENLEKDILILVLVIFPINIFVSFFRVLALEGF